MRLEDKKHNKKIVVSILIWVIIIANIIFVAYVGYNIFVVMRGLNSFFLGLGQLIKGLFELMKVTV